MVVGCLLLVDFFFSKNRRILCDVALRTSRTTVDGGLWRVQAKRAGVRAKKKQDGGLWRALMTGMGGRCFAWGAVR